MRRYLAFLFFMGNMSYAPAQSKVIFENDASGNFRYPAAQLDSFLQLSRYKVLIFGECHTVFFEPGFKYRLIRQRSDSYGIHDVFMEIGHSAAYLFNRYLQTGDTTLLRQPALVYTWPTGNYRLFWDSLRVYNNSLPDAQKIVIHGVDFERAEAFKVLLLLRPEGKPVPASLQEGFRLLAQYAATAPDNPFDKEFLRQLEEIKNIFGKQEAALRDYYAAHYETAAAILHNNAPHTTRVPQRNQFMIEAMKQIITDQHISSFTGFFGNAHTNYQTGASLVNRLNKIEALKGSVLSLNAVYFNTYSVQQKQHLDYIGMIKKTSSTLLYDHYLGKDKRAVMLRSSDITDDKFLHHAADYALLVNDSIEAPLLKK